jgi:hypothetical protein
MPRLGEVEDHDIKRELVQKEDGQGNVSGRTKLMPDEKQRAQYSLNISDSLYNLFDRAIQAAFPDIAETQSTVVITTSRVADYQCNSSMGISQVRKM